MKNVTRDKFDHEIVFDFCDHYNGRRASGTITGYRWSARNFVDWLEDEGIELTNVTWKEIDDFIASITDIYPDSTVKTRYNHLRTFIKWLNTYHGYYDDLAVLPIDNDKFAITEHITRGSTAKKEATGNSEGVVFLRPSEYKTMLQHVPAPKFRNELILKMLWGLGLRNKELTHLKIAPETPHLDKYGSIDFKQQEISVPAVKTDNPRDLWFQDSIGIPLRRWIESERQAVFHADDSEYLFPTRSSTRISKKRVTKIVSQAAENAGIQSVMFTDAKGVERKRISPHAFRHGFAVQHVRNGTNIKVLKDLLGHEDISTTQIYLQFDKATRKEAMHRNAPEV
ncbi:hypothetical protein DVK00_02975 [Haloarcula sp. Atlit-47R]|uniref:tyrosine-type recombinase/integrase n=1 Tax=Haloarcula sp. Atlit-47R TaxID=2282132 RepID=UPI000EF220E8|nr:tyrosine-type recombinase/integrase [Haloarcula sp. Atlit-47R]RLM47487.1 hypothetical protein DVK00_02975 [Haloarcula sp. Atlit-47R]